MQYTICIAYVYSEHLSVFLFYLKVSKKFLDNCINIIILVLDYDFLMFLSCLFLPTILILKSKVFA